MFKIFFSLFTLIFLLLSCENTSDKKVFGQLIGAAVGGYLGSKVGSGVTKDITTIIGGAAGYILGGKIVEVLNDVEKKEFNNVIEDSLNYNPDNVENSWTSNSNENVTGEVIPLNNYKIDNKNCRDFKKIVKKNEEIFEENSTACRSEDGNWILI